MKLTMYLGPSMDYYNTYKKIKKLNYSGETTSDYLMECVVYVFMPVHILRDILIHNKCRTL